MLFSICVDEKILDSLYISINADPEELYQLGIFYQLGSSHILLLKGSFLRTTHLSHDDYAKTIGDIEKLFLHSTANQKTSLEKNFLEFCSSGLTTVVNRLIET